MPIISVKPVWKEGISIQYPNSGKAKLYLEASHPVDVFIVQNEEMDRQITQTPLLVDGKIPNLPAVLPFLGQPKIDTIITLPESWRPNNWYLSIGNSTNEHVAVYYQVNEVPK